MPTYPTIPAEAQDAIHVATLIELRREIKSQTFDKMPAASALWRNKASGTLGNGIHKWGVSAGLNPNAKVMKSDADTVTFGAQNNLTAAWYDYMAMLAVPIQKSMVRESQNSGRNQIVSLVKEDSKVASKTMKRMISSQSFGDGSGSTLIGLGAFLPTVGVGSNTLFNIAEANAPWWANYVKTSFGSWKAYGIGGATDNLWLRAFLNCSDSGAETPDLIISDRTIFEYRLQAEDLLRRNISNQVYGTIGNNAVKGAAGHSLPYMGADHVWDNECPGGTAYFLHTSDIELVEDPNFNFKWIPVTLGTQFLLSGLVLTYRVQGRIDRRNWNGVINGVTP
jgi:hypothetical protein